MAALRRCPGGVLAAVDAAALAAAPSALPVLINAMSERGHLTADGMPLSTTEMLLVVTMVASPAVLATASDEDAFKSAAKAHFVALFRGDGGISSSVIDPMASGQEKGERSLAEVLRRRIDFVAPLRLFQHRTD